MNEIQNLPQKIVILFIMFAFGLRLSYLLNSNPFIDEFTTIFASRAILQHGVPILPSGLLYEHGMLFTYLITPVIAIAGQDMLFILARLPSLFISILTIPILYRIGQRWFSAWAGVIAVALFVFSPEGMVWGGRARMYALTQLLILLIAFFAYNGSRTDSPKFRWLALFTLLIGLLTQFGMLLVVPPMLAGMVVVGIIGTNKQTRFSLSHVTPIIFLRQYYREIIGLGLVLAMAVFVKRLGRPMGMSALGSEGASNPFIVLWETVAYQVGIVLDGEQAIRFLARMFGMPHHQWLTVLAVVCLIIIIITPPIIPPINGGDMGGYIPLIFLWLTFGLTILEMITLLEPFRRNPRYLVMVLPLFYLIIGGQIFILSRRIEIFQKFNFPKKLNFLVLIGFIGLQSYNTWLDLTVAYHTPEPAYNKAFQYVADHWQTDDVVLTMHTSAAALYLNRIDYFAMQVKADQFLLNVDEHAVSTMTPVDRWLGVAWVGTAPDFNQIINEHARVWFVVDTIRLPVYYRSDWLAILNSQMELVWTEDEALVYRTKPNRIPIPTSPNIKTNVQFGNVIRLTGYTLDYNQITFFWLALNPIEKDYTVFVHLRDEANQTLAQWDSQPLQTMYPTSKWQHDELIIDPVQIDLANFESMANLKLVIGFYELETLSRLPILNDDSGEDAFSIDVVAPCGGRLFNSIF